MVCESCRSGDVECWSWAPCDGSLRDEIAQTSARFGTAHAECGPDEIRRSTTDFDGCASCGGPLATSVGYDEDHDRAGAYTECGVCG